MITDQEITRQTIKNVHSRHKPVMVHPNENDLDCPENKKSFYVRFYYSYMGRTHREDGPASVWKGPGGDMARWYIQGLKFNSVYDEYL